MPLRVTKEELPFILQAIQPTLARTIGPVLMKRRGLSGVGTVGLGSGQVIRIAEELVLVTAAHNLDHGSHSNMVAVGLVPPGASTIDGAVWLEDRTAFWMGGGDFDSTDVGLLKLTPEDAHRWGITPIDLEAVALHQIAGNELAIVHGFPFEQAEIEYGGRKLTTKFLTFATAGLPSEQWGTRHFRPIHQLLRYPDGGQTLGLAGNSVRPAKLPAPGGVSGCGIWTVPATRGKPFSPADLKLVGIQYAHLPETQALLGNTMLPVLALMARAFPELAFPLHEQFGDILFSFQVNDG